MPVNSYRLYGAPSIFLGESMSSWLQRLSQQQGLSLDQIFSIAGAKVPNDVDCVELSVETRNLITLCGSGRTEFNLVTAMGSSIQKEKLLQRWIHKNHEGRPVSAFCPSCLKTDRIPYYRVEWRFRFWKYCPVHEAPLSMSCGKCQRTILLDKPILLSLAPPPNLAYCRFCLSELTGDGESLANEDLDIRETVALQGNLMASILTGHCLIAPFEEKISLYVMLRLHQFGLLLSARRGDFSQTIVPEQMRAIEKFLKRIQSQINRKELLQKRSSWRRRRVD